MLGSNNTYSIEELAHLVRKLMRHVSIEIKSESLGLTPLDINLLQCEYSKAQKYTGLEPESSLGKDSVPHSGV